MSRAIYNKAIFHREQQMDRKVYQRARNVLPVTPEPTPTEKTYRIASVVIKTAGTGYVDSFDMTVAGTTDAVIALTASEGVLATATITTAGVFDTDISGDLAVSGGEGSEGVLTVTCEEIA